MHNIPVFSGKKEYSKALSRFDLTARFKDTPDTVEIFLYISRFESAVYIKHRFDNSSLVPKQRRRRIT